MNLNRARFAAVIIFIIKNLVALVIIMAPA